MMRVNFFFFFLTLTAATSLAQIRYEKGYFIDNENQKIECLIKNIDWKNNPTEFSYKHAEGDTAKTGTITLVKEFGIYGASKYIRSNVMIDRTNKFLDKITEDKNPLWSREKLFLKVIVEGKASLYYFEDNDVNRFFYSIADTVQQLIYKKYKFQGNLATNYRFRQQLWIDVRCEKTSMSSVEKIEYSSDELEKYFISYNQCKGSPAEVINKEKRRLFNLKIAPGFNHSSLSIANALTRDTIVFKSNNNFRIGLEAEYILPFNNNKWGIIFEPVYQYFSSKEQYQNQIYIIDYGSVELPVGLRYYFFLRQELKFFLNAHYISNLCINFNPIIIRDNLSPLDITTANSFAFGAGINYRKISIESRYNLKRELLHDYILWSSDFTRVSIIIGYMFLQK